MNFQDLVTIGDQKFYLDLAFTKAKKKAEDLRSSIKQVDRLHKARKIEMSKVDVIRDVLKKNFLKIEESYPSMDSLPEFYQELSKSYFDVQLLKKSIASMKWVIGKVDELHKQTIANIKRTKDITQINAFRRAFYGRVSSVLKQIDKNLKYLEQCRKILRGFPTIKEKLFTIALVGFPNVGKSTLLSKLTFSNVPIHSYAFTTKKLLVGYARIRHEKIQFIDTPGTLARDNKMNIVEFQADLAMKYVADVLVYVFDPTEQYPMAKQEKLLKNVKKFGKPTILYMSKTDIADKDIVDELTKKYPKIIKQKDELMESIEKEFLRY